MSVYATLNNNECQILSLIFVFHFSFTCVNIFLIFLIPVCCGYGDPLEFTEVFGKSLTCLW